MGVLEFCSVAEQSEKSGNCRLTDRSQLRKSQRVMWLMYALLSLNKCWDCLEQGTSNTTAQRSGVQLCINPAAALAQIRMCKRWARSVKFPGNQAEQMRGVSGGHPSRQPLSLSLLLCYQIRHSRAHNSRLIMVKIWIIDAGFGGSFPDGGRILSQWLFQKNITVSLQLKIPQIISTQQSKQTNTYRSRWEVQLPMLFKVLRAFSRLFDGANDSIHLLVIWLHDPNYM